jgi:hypothetical protein
MSKLSWNPTDGSRSGINLETFILEGMLGAGASGSFSSVLNQITLAAKIITARVRPRESVSKSKTDPTAASNAAASMCFWCSPTTLVLSLPVVLASRVDRQAEALTPLMLMQTWKASALPQALV